MSYRPLTSSLRVRGGTAQEDCSRLVSWRLRGIAMLRVAFGCVWAIDAWFKWQPGFSDNFISYLTKAAAGQPSAVTGWLNFWISVISLNPHLFAFIGAVGETGIALGLLFGALNNLTCLVGILLSVSIWSSVQGFGGTYGPESSDNGVAITYVLVFTGLLLGNAGTAFGLDRFLSGKLGRWNWLASSRGSKLQSRRSVGPVHTPIPLPTGYPTVIHNHAASRQTFQAASSTPYRQRARQLYLVQREADADALEIAPRSTAASHSRIVSIRSQRLSRL